MQDWGIWADAVRRVCAEYDTYMPSYPMAAMTIQELHRASLAPTHCRSLLFKMKTIGSLISLSDAPALEVTERAEIRDTLFQRDWEHVYRLLPGGRYLITCGKTNGLCLWDLGIPARELLERPVLVARAETGDLLVQQGAELTSIVVGERVRVAVRTHGRPFR